MRAITFDFGEVNAGDRAGDEQGQLWNSSVVNDWNYSVEAPQPPFSLRSGTLSGNLKPLESVNFVFGVDAPTDLIGQQRFTQVLRVSDRADWILTVRIIGRPAALTATPNISDFGNVFANHTKDQSITIRNDTPVTIAGRVRQPARPFYLLNQDGRVTEGISFSLEPGQAGNIRVAFSPRLSDSDMQLKASLLVETSTPNTLSISVPLQGFSVGPRPINFVKMKATDALNIWDILKDQLFAEGIGVNRLNTAVRFESNTGEPSDLEGLEVWELLSFSGCPTVGGTIIRSLGCEDYSSRVGAKPRPWTADSFFGVDEHPATKFNLRIIDNKYVFLFDGHDLGMFSFPLIKGGYTVSQKYVWTMPWHKSSLRGCKIAEIGLHDTIARSVDLVNDRWIGTVTSVQAGPKSWDILALYFGDSVQVQPNAIRLEWFVNSLTLQAASDVHGPWNDIPSSDTVTELVVSKNVAHMFYRLLPPQ